MLKAHAVSHALLEKYFVSVLAAASVLVAGHATTRGALAAPCAGPGAGVRRSLPS